VTLSIDGRNGPMFAVIVSGELRASEIQFSPGWEGCWDWHVGDADFTIDTAYSDGATFDGRELEVSTGDIILPLELQR
jgi:hypothetical protein